MGLWSQAIEQFRLEPIFGVRAWGANSTCDDVHPGGRIPGGHRVCCMHCHQTGVDDHPYLRETAADKLKVLNWTPEGGEDQWSAGEKAEPTAYRAPTDRPRTRREKRAEQFHGRPHFITMSNEDIGRLLDGDDDDAD